MNPATRSMFVWTAYVLGLGAVLLVVPNLLLSLFQIAETDEVWIRIAGLLLLGYGAYYWTSVRAEFKPMYWMSVWVRLGIVAGLVVLAATIGPWQLVLFATFDLAGAIWTLLGLRADSPSIS